jgi:hypothetical protein
MSRWRGANNQDLWKKVSSHRPSIVDRLAARLVTAQSLQILVHQHYGYRLHLEWNGGNSSRESYRFMERRFFMLSDAQTFCVELCMFGLEGMCSCVYGDYHSFIPEKAPRYLRTSFCLSQKYFLKPKWCLKALEGTENESLCDCSISSTSDTGCLSIRRKKLCHYGISSTAVLDWP